MNRLEANLEILNNLSQYAKLHPDLRFIQLLWATGIITRDDNMQIEDRFYEESEATLDVLDTRMG